MGLLDSLFNADTYGGQGGGLLDFLRATQMQQQNYQPSQGFPADTPPATFADRFNAMPGAPSAVAPSGRSFDAASFAPSTYAPNQAQPIAVGNYQMPRISGAQQFTPDPSGLPPNAQPTQGQLPTDVSAQSRQPQQAPQQPTFMGGSASGGIGNNLMAGLQNFANAGGPLQALAGGITGLVSGNRTDPQGIAQQDRKAQFDAFVGAGLSPQNAMLAVMNPEAGKVLVQQALSTKQKYGETGTDIYGNKKFGFIDEQNQTVNGKPITAQGASSGGGMTGIDENRPVYDQLPKAQQTIVDNMLAGRQAPPGAQALRTPYWNTLMSAATEKAVAQGGTFDATSWGQRLKTAKDFSPSGTAGQSINALDTVQKHIGKLSDDIEKLDNGGWTYWNAIRNGVASNTSLDPARRAAVQAVNDDVKAVTDEMARAYKGGHMSDSEIKSWAALVSSVQAKESGRQALVDFTELLNGKRKSLIDQHRDIMGSNPRGSNDAENQRVTDIVRQRNVGVSQSSDQSAGANQPAKTVRQNGHTYTLQSDGSYR